jgi:hypothetical protein
MGKDSMKGKRSKRFVTLVVAAVAAATLQLASLTAYAAQATLTWTAPTTYVDGSPLTVKGFKLYEGSSPGKYTQNVDVGNVTSYVMGNLSGGTAYYFAVSAYDNSGTLSALSKEASIVTAATPSATLYTLTAAPATGGTITPSGSTAISQGSSQTYTITPGSGYKIAGVTVDGTAVGAVSTYTFSNVTANHTIAASFASSSTGGTGTLASSGSWQNQAIPLQKGLFNATFDMVPGANNIDAVTGLSVAQGQAYTDLATIVRFNSSGAIDARNGSSYAATTAVPYSAGKTYHVRMQVDVPNHRYDAWVTPAGGVESQVARGYAFRTEQAVASALNYIDAFAGTGSSQVTNVSVTSAPATVASYTISAKAYANGSISPSGTTTVTAGSSKTYTITPARGYRVAAVKIDGVSTAHVTSYTFQNVTANHTIAVSFALL